MYWQRRLTRLELGLYALIVAVVLLFFLDRVADTMELAERASMEVTVSQINSGLNIRMATDRLYGRLTRVSNLLERNPFEVAGTTASNSLGELDFRNLEDLERGNWVFDSRRRELVYLPRLHRRLHTGDRTIRFHLVRKGDGMLLLAPITPYVWDTGA